MLRFVKFYQERLLTVHFHLDVWGVDVYDLMSTTVKVNNGKEFRDVSRKIKTYQYSTDIGTKNYED